MLESGLEPSTSDPAAVLVPVYRDHRERLRIVLIRRTRHGIHGGQIAFPGGRPETGDESPDATALREAWEEIGLAAEHVRILAELPTVSTRSSRYEIRPFLGTIRPPGRWRRQPDEVEEVLEPTLESLLAPDIRQRMRVRPPHWHEALDVEALVPGDGIVIWGATYRILEPILEPLRDGYWDI